MSDADKFRRFKLLLVFFVIFLNLLFRRLRNILADVLHKPVNTHLQLDCFFSFSRPIAELFDKFFLAAARCPISSSVFSISSLEIGRPVGFCVLADKRTFDDIFSRPFNKLRLAQSRLHIAKRPLVTWPQKLRLLINKRILYNFTIDRAKPFLSFRLRVPVGVLRKFFSRFGVIISNAGCVLSHARSVNELFRIFSTSFAASLK